MHEDMTVTVRFDNVAGEQTMKVETIGDTKGDQKQVTVVFSSTRHLTETSLLRQQSAGSHLRELPGLPGAQGGAADGRG